MVGRVKPEKRFGHLVVVVVLVEFRCGCAMERGGGTLGPVVSVFCSLKLTVESGELIALEK